MAPRYYHTIDQIKRANYDAGYHFFERASMRFFNSRILPTVYAGCVFVTSERFYLHTPRLYTIRLCAGDGEIREASKFPAFATARQARDAIQRALKPYGYGERGAAVQACIGVQIFAEWLVYYAEGPKRKRVTHHCDECGAEIKRYQVQGRDDSCGAGWSWMAVAGKEADATYDTEADAYLALRNLAATTGWPLENMRVVEVTEPCAEHPDADIVSVLS